MNLDDLFLFLLFKLLSCIQYTERIQWLKQQNYANAYVSGVGIGTAPGSREGGREEELAVHSTQPYYLQVRVPILCITAYREKGKKL